MRPIRLNFLPLSRQDFSVAVYRRPAGVDVYDDNLYYYNFRDEAGTSIKYEVANEEAPGFDKFSVPVKIYHDVVARRLYDHFLKACKEIDGFFIRREHDKRNKRIHFTVEAHPKGRKCVWLEPHYLKSEQKWGILIGFQFVVNDDESGNAKHSLDRDILIATGSLNAKGQSNLDFYLYKHDYLKKFIATVLPAINAKFPVAIQTDLLGLDSRQLKSKEYYFRDGHTSSSSYFGLSKAAPLLPPTNEGYYDFVYLEEDRDYAVALLKGLRGDSHPNTFPGLKKLFQIPFTNDFVRGTPIKAFSEEEIDKKIAAIKEEGKNVVPVIITNARKDLADDKLYYFLKNKFTNAGIACQVVTKDLIRNDNAIKYSLSNIGLQIFAKSGGTPWKMKPAGSDYLIIGIGQSYNVEKTPDGNTVEKNITYSVLTDSSGIFKDIQVLSEGLESDDSYWQKLVTNISAIINSSNSKKVALHLPFRISKPKVLEKVVSQIGQDIELCVLVINDKNDYFGFDYANNGLVPFEGSFVKLSKFEYLVWFEGILPNNPKITKRFGNPLLVKFWYSNKPELLEEPSYREALLQDCINLSGANWRGFKAKQLPVSIFYCQRIAEFIGKFREYHLEHIEINNLKPWFL